MKLTPKVRVFARKIREWKGECNINLSTKDSLLSTWEQNVDNWNVEYWAGPWVNFSNILSASFTSVDPKSHKNTVKLSVFFALLISVCIKALSKHVDEIDPRCQFHQHFTYAFLYKSALRSFSLITVWLCKFLEYRRKSCS